MLHWAPGASTCGTMFNFIADSSLSPHQAACSNLGSRRVVLGKLSHSRVSNQSCLAVEVFCWGCHFLGSLVPGEGAAEVMGKLFLLVTVPQ